MLRRDQISLFYKLRMKGDDLKLEEKKTKSKTSKFILKTFKKKRILVSLYLNF